MELNVIEKLIFFLQKEGGQSDCDNAQNCEQIRLKIHKTEVITTEPPYHAQVWEYPPRGHTTARRDIRCRTILRDHMISIIRF